jgi:hypothetical protein
MAQSTAFNGSSLLKSSVLSLPQEKTLTATTNTSTSTSTNHNVEWLAPKNCRKSTYHKSCSFDLSCQMVSYGGANGPVRCGIQFPSTWFHYNPVRCIDASPMAVFSFLFWLRRRLLNIVGYSTSSVTQHRRLLDIINLVHNRNKETN